MNGGSFEHADVSHAANKLVLDRLPSSSLENHGSVELAT